MERRYDEHYSNKDDRSFDGAQAGYDDRPGDYGRRRGEEWRLDQFRRAGHGYESPGYYDPERNYDNRGYRGEGHFGQSYSGSYPNMPYGMSNTSRFERGFDFDLFRDRRGRGWWPKTRDEIARWFGDEEAERRRQRDERREAMESNRGRGPRNYRRSDERIKDDVSDLLWDSDEVDASDVEVKVRDSEVTLTGNVPSRYQKRCAEYIAENVWGVTDVMNLVRIEATSDAEKIDELKEKSRAKTDTNRRTSAASGA